MPDGVDLSVVAELLGAEPTVDDGGPQGASGSEVRYFSGGSRRCVAKHATLLERRVIDLIQGQGGAVPETRIPDADTPGRRWIYQRFADEVPADEMHSDPDAPLTASVAAGLAHLHAANLQRCPDWLPAVEADPITELYLEASFRQWDKTMANDDFASELGHHTGPLHEARNRLVDLIRDLCAEGSLCTLINSDLTPDHIRRGPDGAAVFIDWEQACYGPLFIDLVNFFDADSVPVYRAALAAEGVEIEPRQFMELFSGAGHWMGLRYLEVGLLAWQLPADDPDWAEVRAGLRHFFDHCLELALNGR